MSGVNLVLLVGRLGQTPKIAYTQSGQAVARLSLATDESYKDKTGTKVERTEWHRVAVFGAAAEYCANYLDKGRLVSIEGTLRTSKWQDKSGQDRFTTEVVVGPRGRIQGLDKSPERSSETPTVALVESAPPCGLDDVPF